MFLYDISKPLIIPRAVKGNAAVVMNMEEYDNKMEKKILEQGLYKLKVGIK